MSKQIHLTVLTMSFTMHLEYQRQGKVPWIDPRNLKLSLRHHNVTEIFPLDFSLAGVWRPEQGRTHINHKVELIR